MQILIKENGRIGIVNFPEKQEKEKKEKFEKKLKKAGGKEKLVEYNKPLPTEPQESWRWNEITQEIAVDADLIPVNWAGLMVEMGLMPAIVKRAMGIDYAMLQQGVQDQDIEYINGILVTAQEKMGEHWMELQAVLNANHFPGLGELAPW